LAKTKDKKKEAEAPPVDGGGEGGEGDAPKKKGLPIMLIAIAGGAVLLLGGGGAAAYFLFLKPKPVAEAHGAADAHGKKDAHGKEKKKDDGHGKKKDDGHGGGGEKVDPKTQPVIAEGPDGVTYFTLPDVVANIESPDGRASYLKMKLTFEVGDEETVELLKESMPRINDILQGFMGELRPEDLSSSAGDYQLRLEILRRINLILSPHKINAVLIEEKLIT
jgi:flagellar protein FliL